MRYVISVEAKGETVTDNAVNLLNTNFGFLFPVFLDYRRWKENCDCLGSLTSRHDYDETSFLTKGSKQENLRMISLSWPQNQNLVDSFFSFVFQFSSFFLHET